MQFFHRKLGSVRPQSVRAIVRQQGHPKQSRRFACGLIGASDAQRPRSCVAPGDFFLRLIPIRSTQSGRSCENEWADCAAVVPDRDQSSGRGKARFFGPGLSDRAEVEPEFPKSECVRLAPNISADDGALDQGGAYLNRSHHSTTKALRNPRPNGRVDIHFLETKILRVFGSANRPR